MSFAAPIRESMRVLVVDDSVEDQALLRHAFRRFEDQIHLSFCSGGTDALRYFSKQAPYANESTPDVCLLDIQMPGMDGFEVLSWLKADPATCRIPVIMYSNSDQPDDVSRAYEAQASSFIRKPASVNELNELADQLLHLWMHYVRFPDASTADKPASSA
ncbi:MAG: response regulator [Pseudomonadota bacterium]